MRDSIDHGVTVGPSILGLVTSGIYDDPLAVYREYIQNAVDELSRLNGIEGLVEITIDSRQRKVSISDNGPGLTYQECLERLVPISQSKKCLDRDRGFRGIGRLSGLAFAETVTFLTRSSARDPVTRVSWSKPRIAVQPDAMQAHSLRLQDWVSVETLDDFDYPDHFFRVEIEGVRRHAAGLLLNREAVRGYISEVCPVPFSPHFPYRRRVQQMLRLQKSPYPLTVTVNNEAVPIRRQYGPVIIHSGKKEDVFLEFEEFRIPAIDGQHFAAIGWIAHSSYLGAIPKGNRIRGIRARVGNIQIGDERVFDHLFEEDRFNRWCVGEVHILDPRITPNGRRDYFEHEPHLRNLENHLMPIFRELTARCRTASSKRNKGKRLMTAVTDLEAMCDLAASGCLTSNDAEAVVEQALSRLAKAYQEMDSIGAAGDYLERFGILEAKLRNLHLSDISFPLSGISSSRVDTYREVFRVIADTSPSPRDAKQTIDAILRSAAR